MSLQADLSWRQAMGTVPKSSVFRRALFSRDWLQPARFSLLAASVFLRVGTLLLIWIPSTFGINGLKVFGEEEPHYFTRLIGNILVPLTVHLMTGAMSGRIFWGLILASSIGRIVFAGGVVWAVNKWREEITGDVDPFAARYPLAAGTPAVSAEQELEGVRDTFIWMWVVVALLVASALHSLYAYFARPTAGLASVAEWGQRRVDEERRREQAAGVDAGPGPNAGAATNEQSQEQPRPRVFDENRPTIYEIGITPAEDDPFGARAEDALEIEEQELIQRASAGPAAPVKPRRIPITLSQIVFGVLTASVAVAMASAPSDWILPYDAEEGKDLAYLIATPAARRATAFMIRFVAVVKLSTCFYPVLVVAEDGRLKTVMNARSYTIMGLVPVCWLSGYFGSGTYYGAGWATGLFFIVDEIVGLGLTFLELMWSIRTWIVRQKSD